MHSRRRLSLSPPVILLLLAVLAYAVYFSWLTITRYAAFEARALDMGNLDQAIWNTARGNWFHLTNQPGTVNRLSLHVEPILVPISWLYWLYDGPPALLVLQAVVVALGALPLYALARRKQLSPWAALALAAAYLLHPSIQAANWLEFHPVTLVPTFLMAAFYFLVAGRTGWYALFAVLAASCKEEIALLVFMLGLYAALALRPGARWARLGALTMALSLLWAFTAVFFIQNAFAAGNIHWNRYGYLGDSPLEMVRALITRPDLVIAQLRAAEAGRYLAQLLLPVAFVSLLAPEVLALALPSLAINLLADFAPMHQVYELIYAAPIVPFVMIAAVYGAARIGRRLARYRPSAPLLRGLATHIAPVAVLVAALASSFLYGYVPWGGNYRHFTISDHDRRAAAVIAQIPADAKVSAQDRLNPHVSGRETIYIFPRIEDADTVFIDVTGPAWPQHPSDVRATVDQLMQDGFGVAAAGDGYLLLRRDAPQQELPPAFYTAWQRPDHAPAQPQQVDFTGKLRLIDFSVTNDEHGEVVIRLYWQALAPLDEDLRFYVALQDRDGETLYDTHYYPPPAVLWYPTSRWEPGQTVLVQTLPWTLDADQFALLLGVYAGENGWTEGGRLPVSRIEPSLPLLEHGSLVRLGGFSRSGKANWIPFHPAETAPAQRIDVRFGNAIVLEGVTLPETTAQPGGELTATFHWSARQPPDADYTAFAHLLDAVGVKAAQLDWQPRDAIGPLPTSAWQAGQSVLDTETLTLPADLAPGDYRLIAGMYHWQDGMRLPAQGEAVEPGDVAVVATIRVE